MMKGVQVQIKQKLKGQEAESESRNSHTEKSRKTFPSLESHFQRKRNCLQSECEKFLFGTLSELKVWVEMNNIDLGANVRTPSFEIQYLRFSRQNITNFALIKR